MFLYFPPTRTTESGFVRISLRVPRYGAILEFLNFACLLVTFILCLFCTSLVCPLFGVLIDFISDKDINTPNAFELLFIVFAAAFALEEYTASVEHGWSGKCGHHNVSLTPLMKPLVYFANVSYEIVVLRVAYLK